MQRDSRSPAAYLEEVPASQRVILDAIRAVIREVDPGIREGIRYGMLDYPGLANLAAQKRHVSLYVASAVLAEHRELFSGVDAGKSCLRFRRIEQVDAVALRRLLEAVQAVRRARPAP